MILRLVRYLRNRIIAISNNYKTRRRLTKLGYCGQRVLFGEPTLLSDYSHLLMYDNARILPGLKLISWTGKLIMGRNSSAAQDLTVITGNHGREIGKWFNDVVDKRGEDVEKDVIVEEDVWIGANVTILGGVKVGRGATIGAGAVIRSSVPPYSIVTGNPAKVVGFSFRPEEIVEHEKSLYLEGERLSIDKLEKNYKKYFTKRLSEIQNYTKL